MTDNTLPPEKLCEECGAFHDAALPCPFCANPKGTALMLAIADQAERADEQETTT